MTWSAYQVTSRELQSMDTYYFQAQSLLETTANPACYLFFGSIPVEALIHITTLCHFGSVMRCGDVIEFKLVGRLLAVTEDDFHS